MTISSNVTDQTQYITSDKNQVSKTNTEENSFQNQVVNNQSTYEMYLNEFIQQGYSADEARTRLFAYSLAGAVNYGGINVLSSNMHNTEERELLEKSLKEAFDELPTSALSSLAGRMLSTDSRLTFHAPDRNGNITDTEDSFKNFNSPQDIFDFLAYIQDDVHQEEKDFGKDYSYVSQAIQKVIATYKENLSEQLKENEENNAIVKQYSRNSRYLQGIYS